MAMVHTWLASTPSSATPSLPTTTPGRAQGGEGGRHAPAREGGPGNGRIAGLRGGADVEGMLRGSPTLLTQQVRQGGGEGRCQHGGLDGGAVHQRDQHLQQAPRVVQGRRRLCHRGQLSQQRLHQKRAHAAAQACAGGGAAARAARRSTSAGGRRRSRAPCSACSQPASPCTAAQLRMACRGGSPQHTHLPLAPARAPPRRAAAGSRWSAPPTPGGGRRRRRAQWRWPARRGSAGQWAVPAGWRWGEKASDQAQLGVVEPGEQPDTGRRLGSAARGTEPSHLNSTAAAHLRGLAPCSGPLWREQVAQQACGCKHLGGRLCTGGGGGGGSEDAGSDCMQHTGLVTQLGRRRQPAVQRPMPVTSTPARRPGPGPAPGRACPKTPSA